MFGSTQVWRDDPVVRNPSLYQCLVDGDGRLALPFPEDLDPPPCRICEKRTRPLLSEREGEPPVENTDGELIAPCACGPVHRGCHDKFVRSRVEIPGAEVCMDWIYGGARILRMAEALHGGTDEQGAHDISPCCRRPLGEDGGSMEKCPTCSTPYRLRHLPEQPWPETDFPEEAGPPGTVQDPGTPTWTLRQRRDDDRLRPELPPDEDQEDSLLERLLPSELKPLVQIPRMFGRAVDEYLGEPGPRWSSGRTLVALRCLVLGGKWTIQKSRHLRIHTECLSSQ